MFPHVPLSSIIEDLNSTKSMDVTVENILDGKLVVPTVCTSWVSAHLEDQQLFLLFYLY